MKWRDINEKHHLMEVEVSAKSTPEDPTHGYGPIKGYVDCPGPGIVPILKSGNYTHTFSWWFDVELK